MNHLSQVHPKAKSAGFGAFCDNRKIDSYVAEASPIDCGGLDPRSTS